MERLRLRNVERHGCLCRVRAPYRPRETLETSKWITNWHEHAIGGSRAVRTNGTVAGQ